MENKTAVEWLIQRLYDHEYHIDILDVAQINGYFKEALEMEKNQNFDFYRAGYMFCNSPILKIENGNIITSTLKYAEIYYNDKFKKDTP